MLTQTFSIAFEYANEPNCLMRSGRGAPIRSISIELNIFYPPIFFAGKIKLAFIHLLKFFTMDLEFSGITAPRFFLPSVCLESICYQFESNPNF